MYSIRYGVYSERFSFPKSHRNGNWSIQQAFDKLKKVWALPSDIEAFRGLEKVPMTSLIRNGDCIEFRRPVIEREIDWSEDHWEWS